MDLILHNRTIIPTLIEENISKYILKLLQTNIYNFSIKYIESEKKLIEYNKYLNNNLKNIDLPFQKFDKGTIGGYNKDHIPLTISGIAPFSGLVQLIDNNLIYFPNTSGLNHWRDSYLYSYAEDQIYVCKKPIDLIKEFMDTGHKLYSATEPIYDFKQNDKPKNLESIPIETIDIKKFI
ncbi:MAG: hypothetical protein WC758_06870 [Candidatus Woesearchaeota archaeon]|jgi:hypothetical protein